MDPFLFSSSCFLSPQSITGQAKIMSLIYVSGSFRPVVFNLFHAAIHFATRLNLTNPSENFQSGICNAVVFAQ